MKKETRDKLETHGVNGLIATLIAAIPLITATWFLIKPSVVAAVGEELKDQVQQTVATEAKPLRAALAIILQGDVDSLHRDIARLQYRRDFPPDNDWTDADAQELVRLETALTRAKEVLTALSTP